VADLILYNANVITMDPACPKAELVAVENGLIKAVGRNGDIQPFRNKKVEIIDCKGKTVIPGFIDAHCHLAAYAEGLVSVDLSPQGGTRSLADVRDRIRMFCVDRPPGTWIRGKGYNEFYLKEKRHPNGHDLDKAAPLHPVKLTHRSGHAHVLNSLGLRLVGITAESGDPPEGLIDRDLLTGKPTGILYGMGSYLAKWIPALTMGEMKEGVERVNKELLSSGITSIQDATSHNDIKSWSMMEKWKIDGIFTPSIRMMLGLSGFDQCKKNMFGRETQSKGLRTGGVKIIVHEITGDLSPSQSILNRLVVDIHRTGLQAVLHCVEEKTIVAACDAIEHALMQLPRKDHRHRIEHCSVCPPALAKRIGSLGIMVVTQPSFIYYSGDRYLETVPAEQLKSLYPIRSLMQCNIHVVGSSDFPIVQPNPLVGIATAVTRKSEKGKPVLPEERISTAEALRMYTVMAAEACFEEDIKGSIVVGKNADLVVLGHDPMTAANDEIKSIRVEMTVHNGNIVWREQ
jgi:predicted amidohydrolase YtcJ